MPTVIATIVVLIIGAASFAMIDRLDLDGDDGDGDKNENGDNDGNGDNGGNGYDPDTHYYRPYPVSAEFEYQRTVVISTSSSMTYTLNLPAPMDVYNGADILQDVTEILPSTTPAEGTTSTDGTSNNMMVFKGTLNNDKTTISVNYKIKTKTLILDRPYHKENSGTVDDFEQTLKDTYNRDAWRIDLDLDGVLDPEDDIDSDGEWDYRIEPTNQEIKNLADSITAGKSTVYDKILAFYEYLISDDILNYKAGGGDLPKACTQTLDEKTGDCDDYSILFISLCRAAGIPARLNFGAMYIKDNSNWNPHAWSEVYLPLKDGSTVIGTVDVVSEQFLIRDAHHVATWVDTGGDITIDGKKQDNLDHYNYLFHYTGSGKLESDRLSSISFTSTGTINVDLMKAEVINNNR